MNIFMISTHVVLFPAIACLYEMDRRHILVPWHDSRAIYTAVVKDIPIWLGQVLHYDDERDVSPCACNDHGKVACSRESSMGWETHSAIVFPGILSDMNVWSYTFCIFKLSFLIQYRAPLFRTKSSRASGP